MSENTSPSRNPVAAARGPKVDFTKPSFLVTIVAGNGPHCKKFAVHHEVICFYSPAFASIFADGCVSIELTDVEVEIFGLLSHWLYTQEIRLADPETNKKSKNVLKTHLLPLAKLWNLAQHYDMPGLQNTVMSRIVPILDTINIVDVTAFIMYVYGADNTKDTPLRALAIHHASHSLTPELLRSFRDSAPRELLYDMSMAYAKHNDVRHNSDRHNIANPNKFHVGIPEVEEDLFGEELNELDCEDPVDQDEEEDEDAMQEHFHDDANEIAEHVLEMALPCDGDFQKEEGADVDQDEELVEDECALVDFFD
ncbi:hypothetical protein BKA65DRAFT_560360 [Rhexocercosporidium sp. MPI-PUGE-AT-0058]|nr:hypothetical protein BKA65DRAFT_560360 [Rhexocercosporidium sp. MPI-PUGE-AT-0058]